LSVANDLGECGFINIEQIDVRAFEGQSQRNFASNSRRRPRDEGPFSADRFHHCLPAFRNLAKPPIGRI